MTTEDIKKNGVILLDGGIGQELCRRCQIGYDRQRGHSSCLPWCALILPERLGTALN